MKTKKHDTSWMVSVALMAAIVIVLANTPLGMIQLPIIKATTVHIPVILGAILLGPAAGAILGGVFGICSLISNTMAPTLLSFAFSPFMSTTGIPGAIKAVCNGKYLYSFCKTVCRSKRCGSQCRMGTGNGNCYSIRNSRGDCSSNFGSGNRKSITWCISKNEYWKCCESKCIEERRPSGSRKRAGRSSFAMYL